MFEKEIEEIKERYNNSIEYLNKLNEITKDYDYFAKDTQKPILTTIISIREDEHSLKRNALEKLQNILQFNKLMGFPSFYGYSTNEKTIEEAAEIVKNVNINDFYFSMCYFIPYYKQSGKEWYKYSIDNKKMLITANASNYEFCILCLNCIHLLNNPKTIAQDLKQKIYEKVKNGETFIFEGCKVTQYKNGKLNIEFSNNELFKNFLNHFERGVQKAQTEYNKRELAKGA